MTSVILLWNYILTPIHMRVAREIVVRMLVPVFLPFNAITGTLNDERSERQQSIEQFINSGGRRKHDNI